MLIERALSPAVVDLADQEIARVESEGGSGYQYVIKYDLVEFRRQALKK